MMRFKKKSTILFDYYVLLFFLVSFLGWLWEVCIYLVREQRFVNRGILIGPWLPIYGAGALMLYFVLGRWKSRPAFVFIVSMTICSALEYAAGYCLEKMWGIKWWDYSTMFLNLNGRICLVSCLMFGVGGVFLVSFFLPFYTGLYHRLSAKSRTIISMILLGLFIIDAAYSADFPNMGRGITY